MGSTSVHIPDALLDELDRFAAERGVSRNRLIVESCRQAVGARKHWPEGFFSNARFSADELAELQAGAKEFARAVAKSRRNRRTPPL